MAPPLRDGLRASATASGQSLNAYIVQVLAAAAGHQARFRGTAESGPTEEEQQSGLREMERDESGNPYDYKERWRHRAARERLGLHHGREGMSMTDWVAMIRFADANCPWLFVEWSEFGGPDWPEDFPRPD